MEGAAVRLRAGVGVGDEAWGGVSAADGVGVAVKVGA